jgi:hypothetical protein
MTLRLPRPLTASLKLIKPQPPPPPPAPKPAPAARSTTSKTAARIATAAQSDFKPAPATLKRASIEVKLPQVTPSQGSPTFRVPQGIVPSKPGIVPSKPDLTGTPLTTAQRLQAQALANSGAFAAFEEKLGAKGPRLDVPAGSLASLKAQLGEKAIDGLRSGGLGAAALLTAKLSVTGAEVAGVAETQAAVSDEAQVEQAAQRVQEAYEEHGAEAAAQVLEEEAGNLGSQELVDALIEEVQPTLEEISTLLAENALQSNQTTDRVGGTDEILASLGAVADLASDAGVQNLVEPLAGAIDELGSNTNEPLLYALELLGADGKGLRLSAALANELNAVGQTQLAEEVAWTSTLALDHTRAAAAQARTAREEADARLQAQLAELEGVLSPEQRQAYIEEFRAENSDIYEAEVNTAAALDQALTQNAAALDQLVLNDPSKAEAVVAAYSDLAQSPLPARAAEFAARVAQDGSPLAEAYEDLAGQLDTLAETAIAGTLTQYQAEAGSSPEDAEAALARFEQLLAQYSSASKLTTVSSSISEASEYVAALRAAQGGDPQAVQALQELLTDNQKLQGLSGFSSGVAAAALGFAVANLPNQSGADLARAVAEAGHSGAELLLRTIGSLEKSGRLATLAGSSSQAAAIARGAEFLQTKVLPGIGALLGVASAVDAFGDLLRDDATPAEWVNAVASSISLLGSVAALAPVAAPFAGVIAVVGAIVSIIGGLVSDAEKRDAFNAEQSEILTKVLTDEYVDNGQFDAETVEAAAEALAYSSDDNNAVVREAGLTTEQLIELMATVPHANDRDFLEGIVQPLAAAGVQGEEFLRTVQSIARNYGGDIRDLIGDALSLLGASTINEEITLEDVLENIAETVLLPYAED